MKQIQRQLFEQWGVLATLTPSEYVKFRDVLGPRAASSRCSTGSSSSSSATRTARCSRSSATTRGAGAPARRCSRRRACTTSSCATSRGRDYPVPADLLERDFSEPHRRREDLLPVFKAIYDAPKRDWEAYEMCEELVDVEETFQLWRFRHMKTVERIIGYKRGTGGSSGVGFLRRRWTSRSSPSCSTCGRRSAP